MYESNSNFNYLQDDLIFEILRKLPVKSLIRFCCVCKSWRTLIRSDYGFIKSHLKQSLSENPTIRNKVLIYSEQEFKENYALEYLNFKMRYLFLGPRFVFVGSCNGILCYHSKGLTSINHISVHLWNPATHEFRTLPNGSCGRRSCGQVFIFFVYDSKNDDYNVIKFHYRSKLSNPLLVGEVYSLRANLWKMINLRSLPPKMVIGSNIVAHNRALYFINASTRGNLVLSVFDIDEEKYDEVSLPDYAYKIKPIPRLGSFKEFLSLSIWRKDFELWVMKEYGVWTMEFVLENGSEIHSPYNGMMASGKILAMNWDGEDVLYDVESQKVEEFVNNKVVFIKANDNNVFVTEYVESLVSPIPPVETRDITTISEIAPSHVDA